MLDRKRSYGEVMGDGVGGARWYQDGHYFAPDGTYLFSNTGIRAPHGCAHRTMEQAEADYQQRQAAQERGEPVAPRSATKAAPKKAAAPPPPPGPLVEPIQAEGLTREQKLAQFNYLQLANLLKAAGGERITGSGAKAKIIAWLLANTSE